MFKTRIESGDTLRLVLFPVFVAFLVLVFAVGLNEAYADTEYEYRDDGTLKETTKYYEENNWKRKLVTEYYKDGSVKTEAYYFWSYWIDDYYLLHTVEYRTDGTLMKSSAYSYSTTNDVAWKNSTTKFNKDGLPIWGKSFSLDGDIHNFTEYKYYKDGKLKKKIQDDGYRHITEYKYYKDGKLKKVIENSERLDGKEVTEYNKDGVCKQLPINYQHHQYMCPADILPDYDWLAYFYSGTNHLIDADTLPDYDYGGSPVKSTWYGNDGYTWTTAKYWDDGMTKSTTYDSGSTASGVPILTTTLHDESGKMLTSTTHFNGVVWWITEMNPDGSMLQTSYKNFGEATDWIQYITEIGADGKANKTTYLDAAGVMWMWEDETPDDHFIRYDRNGNVMMIKYPYYNSLAGWAKLFSPHCPPDRISNYDRDNKPVCLPEPVQECSTDGVTEQDESGRITKTTWRNTDCDLLEYEDRAYWPNGNISQIIRYDADDNMIQFTYHDDNGNIHASHEYEDGEKTKSTFYRTDGSIYRITEYDDDGNISKITEYRKDGSSYEIDP